jgi:membrane protein DedA with SNARE-associated domain
LEPLRAAPHKRPADDALAAITCRPVRAGTLAATESSLGLGLPAVAGVLTAMEAGVPIPIPSDLVVLVLGERASAGQISVVAAVIVLEAVAVAGTALLFFAARGPGRALLTRFGPRLGLTAARLNRATASSSVGARPPSPWAAAPGGLRTVTVVAAGGSNLSFRRALPPLVLGSSVFLQLHLVLGYLLGPAARDALEQAKGPVVVGLVVVALAGVASWLFRRGRGAGSPRPRPAVPPASPWASSCRERSASRTSPPRAAAVRPAAQAPDAMTSASAPRAESSGVGQFVVVSAGPAVK